MNLTSFIKRYRLPVSQVPAQGWAVAGRGADS